MQQTTSRDPSAIRIDFKILTAPRIRGTTLLAQFERLWDETNEAAKDVMNTLSLTAYVSLLKEMDEWFQREQRRGII